MRFCKRDLESSSQAAGEFPGLLSWEFLSLLYKAVFIINILRIQYIEDLRTLKVKGNTIYRLIDKMFALIKVLDSGYEVQISTGI